ncbi:hypothetical protein TPY_3006 [Sulfobacillus acidophilus TPY]|uniref:Uncharacterized protein n=1 Tax=Sulfobacillus acidophilus (strain ATCC 700253 / DSM 10332 / NAL) TaxID=679936 RepID=G8TS63_SULAD|nr:hypothetical protein TPY_3006 [Sulfobacillus acidophilus TPY]AEW04389.1 hypothetical protein Sulac_0886 [Sulfobacillus acidophilus DSM 10332]
MPFLPHLPIRIPNSPGLPIWWDLMWWLFQILVMTSLLFYFNRIAGHLDGEDIRTQEQKVIESKKRP